MIQALTLTSPTAAVQSAFTQQKHVSNILLLLGSPLAAFLAHLPLGTAGPWCCPDAAIYNNISYEMFVFLSYTPR
jgi:hypothetical protein